MISTIVNTSATLVTMSSREIAELVEKRHDNVKRTISDLANSGVISYPQIEGGKKAANGVVETVYLLEKRDSFIVVAQLSPEFTARLVDRWQELEAKQVAPVVALPQDYIQALESLLASKKSEQLALSQLAIAAPKADALDRIAGATGSITIREAAKDLQVKPLKFSNWLKEHSWIYKQGRSNLAYQPRIDAGYMTHKVTLVEVEGDDGVTFEKPVTQARITPKGLAKLAVVFCAEVA